MTYDLVVVGLGYVGLPLAEAASAAGLVVAGFDVNGVIVDGLAAGRSHIDDIGDAGVQAMLDQGFFPTSDPAVLGSAAAISICVPTPLAHDRTPDLGAVKAAVATMRRPWPTGRWWCSSRPPTRVRPRRSCCRCSAPAAGRWGGTSSWRSRRSGSTRATRSYGIRNTPKVVGGVTPACTERADELYTAFVDEVVVAAGTREAEMAKLLENTYRHVNIALVNEMAQFSHELGIDLWDVIRCASTKPFGFQPFHPGPGVGGHCIPIDPNYLSYQVRTSLGYSFRFVELAQEINAGMPAYVVRRAQDQLNEQGLALRGSRVLLLGVSYKPDIADTRETPAREIAHRLQGLGATVSYYDPVVAGGDLNGASRRESLEEALDEADLVILLQAHAAVDYDLVVGKAQVRTRYPGDTVGSRRSTGSDPRRTRGHVGLEVLARP